MDCKCRAQRIVIVADFVAWGMVAIVLGISPGANDALRLPFFVLLGIATVLFGVAVMSFIIIDLTPWLLRQLEPLLRNYVGAFLAGYVASEGPPEVGPGDRSVLYSVPSGRE